MYGLRRLRHGLPYDARYAVTYSDVRQGREFFGEEAYRRTRPSMDKCNFCAQRVLNGRKPACVETCVGSARQFGDLDNPDDPVTKWSPAVPPDHSWPIWAHNPMCIMSMT